MDPRVDETVRRVVARLLAERAGASPRPANPQQQGTVVKSEPPTTGVPNAPSTRPAASPVNPPSAARPLVDAAVVEAGPRGQKLNIPADAIVTPLAIDRARERNIEFVRTGHSPGIFTIAVGADHGGFRLKEMLKKWLLESGHRVIDLGTDSEAACDYPDHAVAVARAVASNLAQFGIMIDGAGIGSSMAANRIPGCLAAICNDPDAARNAREHNYANMMTMGARKMTDGAAREIVQVFLSTPEGESRHGKRVAKIRALDRK